ncbi:cysteine proteinase inhibitor 1 [Gossypium raimondii]|uniref:cysteine proteinase inhibitor 1 n=1 Tax=Gossypium raimondii TaxID=29730 RepID=UPI0007CB104B|nr:cysteine proteinase inhibitor 1 [Gossypium raimondii]
MAIDFRARVEVGAKTLSSFILKGGERKDALIEGWTSIKNIKDPHVTEITEFAVDEHNTQLKGSLKLEEVVKGETQVISGINYKLVLQAKDGTADNSYEAVVWEKAWLKFRKLTSFTLVKG